LGEVQGKKGAGNSITITDMNRRKEDEGESEAGTDEPHIRYVDSNLGLVS